MLLCMSSLPICPLCPYHKAVSPCHMSSVPYPSPPQAKPFADDYFATAYEECSLDRYPPEGVCPDAVLGPAVTDSVDPLSATIVVAPPPAFTPLPPPPPDPPPPVDPKLLASGCITVWQSSIEASSLSAVTP